MLGKPRPVKVRHELGLGRLLVAVAVISACLLARSTAAEQGTAEKDKRAVQAQFQPPASTYSLGEPIPIEFVVQNCSPRPVVVLLGLNLPESFEITAKDGDGTALERLRPDVQWDGTAPHYRIPAGHTRRERILLDEHVVFKRPGKYSVSCRTELHVSENQQGGKPDPRQADPIAVAGSFEITLTELDRDRLTARAEQLARLLGSSEASIRREAARDLAHLDARFSTVHLERALRCEDPIVRATAVAGLSRLGGKSAIPAILRAARAPDATTKVEVAAALGRVGSGDRNAVDALKALLNDKSPWVRDAAATALGAVGDKGALTSLKPLLDDPDESVRRSVARAIENLQRSHQE